MSDAPLDRFGPVDVLVIEFPRGQIRAEGFVTLVDLVERDIVRVLDLEFVQRSEEGEVSIVDIADGSPFYYAPVYRDAEQKLKMSRFSSAIIRCGLYSDFILRHWLKDGQISLPLGNARMAPISRDDVAAAALAVDVLRHHRVPARGLVAEMRAAFQ